MMRAAGYSPQGMSRILEGKQHPGRDRQFRHINAMIRVFRTAGHPVISVDAKKKEQPGPYHRDGRAWRPQGDPVKVRDHDFPDEELGKITPYGIYGIAANRGFVSAGTSQDTAAFAVHAIRLRWQEEGSLRYPGATRLLITCDAGGSSGCRQRKNELAAFARESGPKISVCRFPPGTSKRNKTGHRLFCRITRTWRARPLMTADDAVAGITAAITGRGLKCHPARDGRDYPEGVKVSGRQMRYLEKHAIVRHGPHRDRNCTTRPAPRSGPAPDPAGPGPALIAALAALAGIPALETLRDQAAPERNADRTRRLAPDLGHERRRAPGSSTCRKLSGDAILAAAACHLRLRMPWALPGRLSGVRPSSISVPAGTATPALASPGIAPQPGTPRISTIPGLLAHAAASGITLTIPGTTPAQEENRHTKEDRDTPDNTRLKTDVAIPCRLTSDCSRCVIAGAGGEAR
jgi:hypothetical protein